MIKVGLTGGIGSGKSTIAKIFEQNGIPVFYADDEAKAIAELPEAQDVIKKEFGTNDKKELAQIVFSDAAKLQKLNMLLHPLVKKGFQNWVEEKSIMGEGGEIPPYVMIEAAILFESGFSSEVDTIITVEAERALRIQRVMERDKISEEEVLRRMKWQFNPRERIIRSKYVIVNNGTSSIEDQVEEIHEEITNTKIS